jgi:Protein of unknown function (DUF3667)
MSAKRANTATKSCLNCGARLTTPFCGACGQKAHTERISLKYLLHEIPHAIFHVDRGLVPTVVGVFKRPGVVVDEYLSGKRAKYFNPLTLLILCSSLCAAMWLMFPFKSDVFWAGTKATPDPQLKALLALWFKVVGFTQLLWLPLMGWLLRVTGRGAQQYRIQQELIAQDLQRLHKRAQPSEGTPGPSRMARLWTLTQAYWINNIGWLTKSQQAHQALKRAPEIRNYGEWIVVAAFMTSVSLLISALLSPALYMIDSTFFYPIAICFAALAACVPVYHLLSTSPELLRPMRIVALMTSLYFVIGTPYGFLLAAWLHYSLQ